jgi:hypothetical protein
MFIERGGAPPAMFGTAQPNLEQAMIETTEPYHVYDTTGPMQPTEVPSWAFDDALTPNPASFLEQIGLRLINFGQTFEKAAFGPSHETHTVETTAATYPDNAEITTAARVAHVPLNPVANIQEVNPGLLNPDGKSGVIIIDPDQFLLNQQVQEQNRIQDLFNSALNLTSADGNLSEECINNTPFPFCDENGCSNFSLTIYTAFQILLLVLIVASNITIISVINDMNKNSRNRSNKSNNIFKLSLALGDLFLGLSILPGGIQQSVSALIDIESFDLERINFLQLESINSIPAIIFGGGAVISSIVGIWSIFLMKVDLFLRIKFPMRQHTGSLMNTNRARALVIFLWLLAFGLVMSLWPLGFNFAMSKNTLTYWPALIKDSDSESDSLVYLKALVYMLVVWGLPFIMTIPLGAYLLHTISAARKKLNRKAQASYIKRHADHIERKQQNKKDWEATCRILCVEVVYVITFLPIILSNVFLYNYGECNRHAVLMNFISQYILVVGSFVNLFVYHLMWKDFQVKLRSLFCGKSSISRANQSQVSTINHTSATLDNQNSTAIHVTFEIPSN